MQETSLSLLNRLRETKGDEAWAKLNEIYLPLIQKWLITYDVQATDADDLSQDVLVAVARDIRNFHHNGRRGAFRAWLKGILINRLRNFWRARDRRPDAKGGTGWDQRLAELDDPNSQISQLWNQEHDQFVMQRLMKMIQPQFEEKTWRAFEMVTLQAIKPSAVAKNLEISVNAVFVAKSRVLSRLREQAAGLIDSSSDFYSKT